MDLNYANSNWKCIDLVFEIPIESIYLPRSGCDSKPRVAVKATLGAQINHPQPQRGCVPLGATRTGLIISNRYSQG